MNMNLKQGDVITYIDGSTDTVTDVFANGIVMVEKGFGDSTSFTKDELAKVLKPVMQLPPPATKEGTPVNGVNQEDKNLRKERFREELNSQRAKTESALSSNSKQADVAEIVKLGISAVTDIVTKALNKL